MASADPARVPPNDAEALAVAAALRLESFFPEFTGEQCAKIFPRSGVAVYEPGAYLIEQGETGRDLFILLDGAVAVMVSMGSAGAQVASLSTGALLGEMALLSDGQRTASAVASIPTRAFRLVYQDMGYVLQNNPELAEHLKGLAKQRSA